MNQIHCKLAIRSQCDAQATLHYAQKAATSKNRVLRSSSLQLNVDERAFNGELISIPCDYVKTRSATGCDDADSLRWGRRCFTACLTDVVVTSPDLESHCAKGTCYTSREQCNTAMSACWSPKVVEKHSARCCNHVPPLFMLVWRPSE